MPLLYTSITINKTILCEYTAPDTTGNFISVANNVIKTLNNVSRNQLSGTTSDRTKLLDNNTIDNLTKNTYIYDNYMFHILQQYSGINKLIILTMSTLQYNTSVAYKFLHELLELLLKQYEIVDLIQMNAYNIQQLYSHTIDATQSQYNTQYGVNGDSKMIHVNTQINDVKSVMIDNIDCLLDRGDKIELLVQKTDMLNDESIKFKKSSKQLKIQYIMKNIRLWVMLAAVLIAVIYIIVAAGCGGPTLPNC